MSEISTYTGQIVPMVLHEMKDFLEVELITNVPENDPTRALLIEIGRFRENPTDVNVYVALTGGNPLDPDQIDGRIDHEKLDDIEIPNLPVGEIGGGTYWWRRGLAQLGCFFIKRKIERDDAVMYAYDFLGRVLDNLERLQLNLTDDRGEKATGRVFIEGNTFFETGGQGKWIWRGDVYWRILTWRP